jgi:hypothetical protein
MFPVSMNTGSIEASRRLYLDFVFPGRFRCSRTPAPLKRLLLTLCHQLTRSFPVLTDTGSIEATQTRGRARPASAPQRSPGEAHQPEAVDPGPVAIEHAEAQR